jgi:hypothetical protein
MPYKAPTDAEARRKTRAACNIIAPAKAEVVHPRGFGQTVRHKCPQNKEWRSPPLSLVHTAGGPGVHEEASRVQ